MRAKDANIKRTMAQMPVQAEFFNITHGSYRGTDTNGWQNDDVNECTNSPSSLGSILDQNTEGGITDLIKAVHAISNNNTNARVFCRVSNSSQVNSWAFSAPLYIPDTGTTGWCVDSSGTSKAVNFSYTMAGLSYDLTGPDGVAMCP
jgi:hypothetical protein